MNILYLDHYAGALKYGRSFRPHYLGREWTKMGHNLTVIGGSFSHLRQHQPDAGTTETIDGITYHWLKTPTYQGNGVKRAWSMVVFMFQLFFHTHSILKRSKPDVIIGSTVYMLDMFPAWIMKKITGATLIFELHDVWPASPIELDNMSKWHPFILLMRFAQWWTYKTADRIVSILPKTYEHIKHFGVKKERWSHVPNGIVLEDWQDKEPLPEDITQSLHSLKNQKKFLVGYAGQLSMANTIEHLLEAVTTINEPNIHVVLFGDGQTANALKQQAETLNLTNISFMGRIPKASIPNALEAMDILYFGLQDLPLYRFGLSLNKSFDYMMAAKPILLSSSAGNDPVTDARCGISVASGDITALTNALQNLYSMPQSEREKLGKNGQDFVIQNHDYQILAKKFLHEYT